MRHPFTQRKTRTTDASESPVARVKETTALPGAEHAEEETPTTPRC